MRQQSSFGVSLRCEKWRWEVIGGGRGRRDATGASERRVRSEQKGTWFASRLQASKSSARPGVSAHWMGVKFHSNENGERLFETPAWNLGWRVNYSWYSALTWSVKQTQNGPKPSLPSRLFYPEADLAAVNNANMLYLEKWILLEHIYSLRQDVHHAFGQDGCFFSCCGLGAIEISWGELEESDSCHRAIKSKIFLLHVRRQQQRWKMKVRLRFPLIQLSPWLFPTSRAETHQRLRWLR